MTYSSKEKRASGILAHISSLPSPYGIGDIGTSAQNFIRFLSESGQKYWQILPTTPTSLIFGSSPYMSTSAFAGSPLLISPDLLLEKHLIDRSHLTITDKFSQYLTDYKAISKYKQTLLAEAFKNFSPVGDKNYNQFITESEWLEDYASFMTIRSVCKEKPWYQWPHELITRSEPALRKIIKDHGNTYRYYLFEQYLFHSQWSELKQFATDYNVKLIGDIPIYLSLDSADVWSHQKLFELDHKTFKPFRVSGVPPDYFSETGQRWGNPLYLWNSKNKEIRNGLLDWWTNRFKAVFNLVHVARIDHFRGFDSYWAIPEKEKTAVNGTWVKGPGAPFFKEIQSRLGSLNIIAEDLGEITESVILLRKKLGFPGMKVLQFAFDGNPENPFLPYNFETPHCIVYTGTHDNDTTLGWYLSNVLNDDLRRTIKKTANRNFRDDSPINEDLIYLALCSTADIAIFPLQDLLGFGSDCRMNTPGVPTGNWKWRCAQEFLTRERSKWLEAITRQFGR